MVQALAVGLYMRPGPNFLYLLSQFNPLQRLMFVNDGHGQGWGRGGTTRLTLKHLAPYFFTAEEIPRQYSDHICENLDKHPHLRDLQTSLVWRSEIDNADIEQSTFPLKKEKNEKNEKNEKKKDDNVLSRRGGFFNCLTQDTM
jgi:hypothetical protein